MSSWLHKALRRSEYSDEVIFARDQIDVQDATWETILASGLWQEALPARHVWCPECGDEPAELVTAASDERTTLYLCCPGCGVMAVHERALRRWRFCFDRLPPLLRALLELSGTIQPLVRQRVWQLGRRTLAGASYTCFLARGLQRGDALQLLETVKFPSRALVLVPGWPPRRAIVERLPCPTVPLTDVLSWQAGGVECDSAALIDALPAQPSATSAPRPRKRAGRAAAIEALKQQLAEHLRAARDHAQASLDLAGAAALLPRPSQKDLAKLTGLKEVTVSRCLRDPAARELRMLWDLASDLEAMLRLPGAKS